MADDTVAELNERFGTANKELEEDIVNELQSIMRLHQLSVEDMFFKWESYCIKMDMDESKLSYNTIRAFKQDLQDALERSHRTQANVKPEKRVGATPRTGSKVNNSDVFGMLDGLTSTPGSGRAKTGPKRTPAVSRVKAEPQSSPVRLEDQLNSMGAIP